MWVISLLVDDDDPDVDCVFWYQYATIHIIICDKMWYCLTPSALGMFGT